MGGQERGPNPRPRAGLAQGQLEQQGGLFLSQNGSRLLAAGMKTPPKTLFAFANRLEE